MAFIIYILDTRKQLQKKHKYLAHAHLLFSCVWKWQPNQIYCLHSSWFTTFLKQKIAYFIAFKDPQDRLKTWQGYSFITSKSWETHSNLWGGGTGSFWLLGYRKEGRRTETNSGGSKGAAIVMGKHHSWPDADRGKEHVGRSLVFIHPASHSLSIKSLGRIWQTGQQRRGVVFSVPVPIHKAEHRKIELKLRDNSVIASKLLHKMKGWKSCAHSKLYDPLKYTQHS